MDLKDVYRPIKPQVGKVRTALAEQSEELKSSGRLKGTPGEELLDHFFGSSGKLLRPCLVLLTAGLVGGRPERAVKLGVAVELVHSASLIHDDIIDEADFRRGQESLNCKFTAKTALLLADALYSRAFVILSRDVDAEYVTLFSGCVQNMCVGELRALTQGVESQAEYMELIQDKTAGLTAACGRAGARFGGAPETDVTRLEDFGNYFGILYQLRDDLHDGESPLPRSKVLELGRSYRKRLYEILSCFPENRYGQSLRELATVRRSKSIPVQLRRTTDLGFNLRGSVPMTMSEFEIDPPTVFLA